MSFPRVRCYSEFKHMLRHHDYANCCNGGGGSIFSYNTTYNINTGCNSGFWGGFAHGLGAGIGGFLGGIFGNFMGGFGFGGGFGMGGFGFGGFPSFGFGNIFGGGTGSNWDFGNVFGGGYNAGGANSSNNSSNSTNSTSSRLTCKDKDDKLIKDYDKEIKDTKKPLTEERAKTLYKEISALAEKPKDKTHEEQNKIAYAGLLKQLEDLAENKSWNLNPSSDDGTASKDKEGAPAAAGTGDGTSTTQVVSQDGVAAQGAGSGDVVNAGATNGTGDAVEAPEEIADSDGAEDVSPDAGAGDAGASKLSNEEKQALTTMGCIINNDKGTITLPTNLTVDNLKKLAALSQKAGFAVKVAHNPDSDDEFIAGKIEIPENCTDDNLTFTVDCSTYSSSTHKFTYTVAKNNNNNKYTVSYKSGNAETDLYTKPNTDYKLNKQMLETRGEPVISKHYRADYKRISK